MIELESTQAEVKELLDVKEEPIKAVKTTVERPRILNAKVYKLKSAFVDHAVYITLSYLEEKDGSKRPFEVFINSKDLTKAAEYSVLTRLISAIFRRSEDPTFILEELKSIYDPNGGRFENGRYVPSFYAEIAYVFEEFFIDIGIMKPRKVLKPKTHNLFAFFTTGTEEKEEKNKGFSDNNKKEAGGIEKGGPSIEKVASRTIPSFSSPEGSLENQSISSHDVFDGERDLRICPKCGQKTLKVENGCMTCINPECGYSKCDD